MDDRVLLRILGAAAVGLPLVAVGLGGWEGLALSLASTVPLVLTARRLKSELDRRRTAAEERGDQLAHTLARHVSPQVADVLAKGGERALWTGRREITVLFADLSGFTRYAEQVRPDAVVATLGNYLAEMCSVALQHRGTVDKFIGDEVMVLFNAPTEQSDHATLALAAARDMQLVSRVLNQERAAQGHAALELSIGVNTGEAVVGPIGGDERVQYTAIGDAVNVAKRLQGLASAGEIMAGSRTMELAGESDAHMEEFVLRNRAGAVRAARIAPAVVPGS